MFNPYEWHVHHKPGKPRWRVRAGQAEKRLDLIDQLQALSDLMETETTFANVDKWYDIKQSILDCEEFES